MKRVPAMLFGAVLTLGCESGEVPVRGADDGVRHLQYAPTEQPSREPVEAPRPEPFRPDFEAPKPEEDTPKRDLAAELKAAIGMPIDCVRDFTAPKPTKIRISIVATVRPTGMIITPSAYGSGLSMAARECVERRVGTVMLPALEEPVSQPVSTVVEIDYEPPVIVEDIRAGPEPQLSDVREPLPKRPSIPLDAKFISGWPTKNWISGGFDGGVKVEGPKGRKVHGPKPRAIDGYHVDENAQVWTE